MAINQKLAPCEPSNEDEGSTNNSSYSSSSDDDHVRSGCSEAHEGDEEVSNRGRTERLIRRNKGKATLRACGKKKKNSPRAAGSHGLLKRRLHNHLASLRSLLPPTERSCQTFSTVIADALKYRKALRKEIQQLEAALPFAQQVNVRRVESGGFQIGIACKKKSGLLVALMEAMESFGLLFANVSVSCQNDSITMDSFSTQEIGDRVGALKEVLVATIHRFNQ